MLVNDRVMLTIRLRPQARNLFCSIIYFDEISILLKNITTNRSKNHTIRRIAHKINQNSEKMSKITQINILILSIGSCQEIVHPKHVHICP